MDYSQWLTDETAATVAGCSTRTLRKLAKEKKIETRKYQNPDTGAWQTRYNPEDAARIHQERNPDAPPFALPPSNTAVIPLPNADHGFQDLVRAIERIAARQMPKTTVLKPSELKHKLYLNAEESVAYTGLSIATIRRELSGVSPKARRFRSGPVQSEVFRRADLETL